MQKMLPAVKNINCVGAVERRADEKKGTLNGRVSSYKVRVCGM